MSADQLSRVLQRAVEQGLLPAHATATSERRPWSVVILTALGAWLAAVPLLVLIALVLDDWHDLPYALYATGGLLVLGAAAVLRMERCPLFLEQLAVPALWVGGVCLAYGVARDGSIGSAGAAMGVLAVSVALWVRRMWLSAVLGAVAAASLGVALQPDFGGLVADHAWWVLHVLLLCALALGACLHHAGAGRSSAARGDALLSGWGAATLIGLAAWSGMSFLVPGVAGDLARWIIAPSDGGVYFERMGSVMLAAAAWAIWLWAWPVWWHPGLRLFTSGLIVVSVALSWFMPAWGGLLVGLVAAAMSHRWRLAALAAAALVWSVGAVYYQMDWPFTTKAWVLALAGGALLVLAGVGGGLVRGAGRWSEPASTASAVTRPSSRGRWPAVWLALAVGVGLVGVNTVIWRHESLIAHGQRVYVRLAPVDPRSLMQGDYMRLNFALPPVPDHLGAHPQWIVRLDANEVAQGGRLATRGEPLAPGEIALALRRTAGGWVLASDAWFFREGEAQRWEGARFGEFRVGSDGRALLVGLADAERRSLAE